MDYLFSILDKILFIIILMGTGVLAKRRGWISDAGERDLSLLSVDFIWPCMIFSSVSTNLTYDDIVSNLPLPLLVIVMHLAGYAVGLLLCRFTRYSGDRRKMFLFHAAMNNFLVMALPFVQFFFPQKGTALLAVANLGSILCLWTVGVYVMAGAQDFRTTMKNIFSPGMIAIIASIFCVLTGINRHIPVLVTDVMHIVGQPTMLIGLMVAGCRIYDLGFRALKFDGWNLLVGLTRNIVMPGFTLLLALSLKGVLSPESLGVFCIVGITPASVNSVTLGMKYGTDPGLGAEGVIFTHILAIASMPAFVILVERFILIP